MWAHACCGGIARDQLQGWAARRKVAVQLLNCFRFFVTPWTAAGQTSLYFTMSQSLLKLLSIELVMPSNHLILCCPLLLLLSVFSVSLSFPMNQLFPLVAKVLELQLQHRSFQRIFREGREEGSPAVRIRLPSFRARQLPNFPFILFSSSETETTPGEKEWKAQGQSLIEQVKVQKSLCVKA